MFVTTTSRPILFEHNCTGLAFGRSPVQSTVPVNLTLPGFPILTRRMPYFNYISTFSKRPTCFCCRQEMTYALHTSLVTGASTLWLPIMCVIQLKSLSLYGHLPVSTKKYLLKCMLHKFLYNVICNGTCNYQ